MGRTGCSIQLRWFIDKFVQYSVNIRVFVFEQHPTMFLCVKTAVLAFYLPKYFF